ncbi:VOC family protein [Citricoccus sp. SGAir0253]|uniref:VOC family protein n=1 Tax=Citricoccus sp. SGAir0253 TaxID=2567881 RepID=UPI0010CCE0D0|nr:VOC family protein [Citricoccus sp. SGAir0253]QCU79116.1 VOC family protein [Citricoccus sp. SGAir0253]
MTDHLPTANTDELGIRHGSPVWIDLTVPDLAAVIPFYEALFGWDFEDYGEPFGHYHMITNGGAHVGGAMAQGPDSTGQAAWSVYLKSEDIDRSLAETAAAGGTVLVPAMPVGDLGRMGVVTTPGGEALGVWQNGTFGGFTLTRTVGSPVWFEVMSLAFDADAEYYRRVWGWEPTLLPMEDAPEGTEPTRYANDRPGEGATAGLCEADPAWFPEGTPSYWRAYFIVQDADEAARTVGRLGGSVLDGPMDTPFGRIATVADPAGATFQLVQMQAEDYGRETGR